MAWEMDEAMFAIKSIGGFSRRGRKVGSRFSAFVGALLDVRSARCCRMGSESCGRARPASSPTPVLCFQSSSGDCGPDRTRFGSDQVLLSALERARESGEPVAVDNRPRMAGLGNNKIFLLSIQYTGNITSPVSLIERESCKD